MRFFEYIDLVSRFHQLLLLEQTGNAEAFAKKLHVSRASVYNLIEEFKMNDIPILYSRYRKTYYYQHPEQVEIVLVATMKFHN